MSGRVIGSGEMAQAIRSLDWASTPLGPADRWPFSLSICANMMLASHFPSAILWGDELILLYNDAYRIIAGEKHPDALGRSTKDIWSEVWHVNKPIFEAVMGRGEAVFLENQLFPIRRSGRHLEETYFTVSYRPIFLETGVVGGCLVTLFETTHQFIKDRRLSMLFELRQLLTKAQNHEELYRLISQTLERHPEDIPFALLYFCRKKSDRAQLCLSVGIPAGTIASPVSILLTHGMELPWSAEKIILDHDIHELNDIEKYAHLLRSQNWPEPPHAALLVPLSRTDTAPLDFLVVGVAPGLVPDDDFRQFVSLVGSAIVETMAEIELREELQFKNKQLLRAFTDYDNIFKNMMNGMAYCQMLFDESGYPHDFIYLSVNKAFSIQTGLQDVVGKRVSEVIPGIRETDPELLEIYGRVALTGKPETCEFNLKSLNQWFEISVHQPILGHFVAVFNVITERKRADARLMESRATLASALASMSDAVFISDSEGRFIEYNDAFVAYHRFKDREHCSRQIADCATTLEVWGADGQTAPPDQWAVPRALRGETVSYTEYTLRRKDTGETWIGGYSFAPIRNKDGKIVGSVVTARDITKRKQDELALQSFAHKLEETVAERTKDLTNTNKLLLEEINQRTEAEANLRRSEERFKTMFYEAPLGIALIDSLTGQIYEVNPKFAEIAGRSVDELIRGIDWMSITHPDDVQEDLDNMALLNAGKIAGFVMQKRYLHSSGNAVWINMTISPLKVKDPTQPRHLCMIENITERKRAEVQLLKAEKRITDSLDKLIEGCQMIRFDWSYLYLNDSGAKQARKSKEELLGRKIMEVLPGIEDTDMFKMFKRVMEERKPQHMENEFTYYDGAKAWFELSVQPIDEGIFILSIDITERKRAEQVLRDREEHFRVALEGADLGSWDLDLASNRAVRSLRHDQIFGYHEPQLEWGLQNALAHVVPEDLKLIEDAYDLAYKTGRLSHENRIVWLDGSVHWIGVTGSVRRDDEGRAIRIFGVIADITERKLAEESLQRSERRLRRFYESGMIGVFYFDIDGTVTEANDAYFQLVGYDRRDLAEGRINWKKITPEEYLPRDEEIIRELVASGITRQPFEKEYIHKDGSRVPIIIACAMLDEKRFEGVAFVLDITKRKQAEEELKKLNLALEVASQAKNKFLATMSHDLRTPLNAVIGFSELLLMDNSANGLGPKQRERIQPIADAGHHLLNLVEGMLNLSAIEAGKITLKKEMIDLKVMLEKISTAYELLAGQRNIRWLSDIKVTRDVFVDMHRLWEVLNNLVNNALKYTPELGSITLGVREAANEVAIFVKDTGVGIDKTDFERIFIPFEQGKSPGVYNRGKSVGLGLAICRQLVELHGGRLTVESTRGEGSCFTVTLPYIAEEKPPETPVYL